MRWILRIVWRRLLGRDLCERCDGSRGEPGNENVLKDGTVVCDSCHIDAACGELMREAEQLGFYQNKPAKQRAFNAMPEELQAHGPSSGATPPGCESTASGERCDVGAGHSGMHIGRHRAWYDGAADNRPDSSLTGASAPAIPASPDLVYCDEYPFLHVRDSKHVCKDPMPHEEPSPASPGLKLGEPCVFGKLCARHGFLHGAEAEELRENLERIASDSPSVRRILDRVDARDSLAYMEVRASEAACTNPGTCIGCASDDVRRNVPATPAPPGLKLGEPPRDVPCPTCKVGIGEPCKLSNDEPLSPWHGNHWGRCAASDAAVRAPAPADSPLLNDLRDAAWLAGQAPGERRNVPGLGGRLRARIAEVSSAPTPAPPVPAPGETDPRCADCEAPWSLHNEPCLSCDRGDDGARCSCGDTCIEFLDPTIPRLDVERRRAERYKAQVLALSNKVATLEAASPSLPAPVPAPVPGGLRPAREIVHEILRSIPGFERDCLYDGPCIPFCLRIQSAIVAERDRATRIERDGRLWLENERLAQLLAAANQDQGHWYREVFRLREDLATARAALAHIRDIDCDCPERDDDKSIEDHARLWNCHRTIAFEALSSAPPTSTGEPAPWTKIIGACPDLPDPDEDKGSSEGVGLTTACPKCGAYLTTADLSPSGREPSRNPGELPGSPTPSPEEREHAMSDAYTKMMAEKAERVDGDVRCTWASIEAVINKVIEDTTADLLAVVDVAVRESRGPAARIREMRAARIRSLSSGTPGSPNRREG